MTDKSLHLDWSIIQKFNPAIYSEKFFSIYSNQERTSSQARSCLSLKSYSDLARTSSLIHARLLYKKPSIFNALRAQMKK